MSARRTVIVVGSAVAVWALLFLILPSTFSFDYDQNVYLGDAAALRAGHGYRFEQYIDLPRIGVDPPGYSAWLAAFWKYGQPFVVNSYRLEVANWIAAGCMLFGLAACLVISEMPALAASAVLVAIGTSEVFTVAMTGLRADVLFTGGSCLLALLLAAYEPDRKLSLWWFAAGLLTALLYLVKTAALAYIVALGVFGLFRGDLRDGEAGLQILRQRRPGAVLQEKTRRPMPRLLQEALWLGPVEQEDRARSEDEGRQVVLVEGRIGSRSGLSTAAHSTRLSRAANHRGDRRGAPAGGVGPLIASIYL